MSDAGKYLFGAANVWAVFSYCLLLVARCLETIDVCIGIMFVCMSVVVTGWECLLCSGRC